MCKKERSAALVPVLAKCLFASLLGPAHASPAPAITRADSPLAGSPRLERSKRSFSATFAPVSQSANYTVYRMSINPLVSSGFRSTPDYEYLYCQASVYGETPRLGRNAYAR